MASLFYAGFYVVSVSGPAPSTCTRCTKSDETLAQHWCKSAARLAAVWLCCEYACTCDSDEPVALHAVVDKARCVVRISVLPWVHTGICRFDQVR